MQFWCLKLGPLVNKRCVLSFFLLYLTASECDTGHRKVYYTDMVSDVRRSRCVVLRTFTAENHNRSRTLR